MSKQKKSYKSKCCGARVETVSSPDEIDKIGCTIFYKCLKCNCACDVLYTPRKTWNINPRTRIKPNKNRKELTQRELNKIKREEEF